MALLEAMASGKYVLGSNISGIKDQLIEFPSHLFQPGNVDELQQELHKVFDKSKEELKQEGAIFRMYVQENHTIGQEVKRTEGVYRKLIE